MTNNKIERIEKYTRQATNCCTALLQELAQKVAGDVYGVDQEIEQIAADYRRNGQWLAAVNKMTDFNLTRSRMLLARLADLTKELATAEILLDWAGGLKYLIDAGDDDASKLAAGNLIAPARELLQQANNDLASTLLDAVGLEAKVKAYADLFRQERDSFPDTNGNK